MDLLKRFDVVHWPNGTATWDDGEVDHVRVRGENGLWSTKSIKATPEEIRQREIDAFRRELTGVEFRLEHLDHEPGSWVTEPPSPESVERERTSLQNTRQTILTEIELREGNGGKDERKRKR
jgi:hypothetical protein